jgi:hypothetical protein
VSTIESCLLMKAESTRILAPYSCSRILALLAAGMESELRAMVHTKPLLRGLPTKHAVNLSGPRAFE